MNPWFRPLATPATGPGAGQAASHGLPGAQPESVRIK